ncbi:uncharacterized protein KY384_007314 [Bacidia gigantensis]|uniref:uncharacterized protein n=1 Tax=Bacidia gigantensis TaxID=2732470 RepID=UPI001D041BFF|nr:uncharacterized protein KY384_007314 [Bacidia gigantensis]KAG8528396.1 hypothetical protein KY384_007314 [Bacidia gigantensis]
MAKRTVQVLLFLGLLFNNTRCATPIAPQTTPIHQANNEVPPACGDFPGNPPDPCSDTFGNSFYVAESFREPHMPFGEITKILEVMMTEQWQYSLEDGWDALEPIPDHYWGPSHPIRLFGWQLSSYTTGGTGSPDALNYIWLWQHMFQFVWLWESRGYVPTFNFSLTDHDRWPDALAHTFVVSKEEWQVNNKSLSTA